MIATTYRTRSELIDRFQAALSRDELRCMLHGRRRDERGAFARSVVEGLENDPPKLDCRYLYDARGSALFEQITAQPEYYPTRTEAAILSRHARDIIEATGAARFMELGSGSAEKTGRLLDAAAARGGELTYVPVDVSEEALHAAGAAVAREHRNARVIALNATYEEAFPLFEDLSPLLCLFLGGTVGNFPPPQADLFWTEVTYALHPRDHFLVGVDLVKNRDRLEQAYNDAAGVTAEFTKNLFVRMNRELGSGVDVRGLRHEARFDEAQEQIEIHAHFTAEQSIGVKSLEWERCFEAGSRVLVEISRKFRLDRFPNYLAGFGLQTRAIYTDAHHDFALLLLQRGNRA